MTVDDNCGSYMYIADKVNNASQGIGIEIRLSIRVYRLRRCYAADKQNSEPKIPATIIGGALLLLVAFLLV